MSDLILQTTGLTIAFGGLTAVNRVDFGLLKGDVHAIIGPNGAGKTTFFNLVTGYLKPDSGRVAFKGEDITGMSPFEISEKGLLRSFQVAAIYPMLTVIENTQVGLFAKKGVTFNFFKKAKTTFREEASEILKRVGLLDQMNVEAGQLSHGDRKKLELAMVMANEPELMLLDEPTAGMSLDETRQTMNLIQRIAEEERLTILFTEHDMSVVFGIAKKITVLHQGSVFAEGATLDVKGNKAVQNIYLGEE